MKKCRVRSPVLMLAITVLILSFAVSVEGRVDVGFKLGANFPSLLRVDTITVSGYSSYSGSWGPDFVFARGMYGAYGVVSITSAFSLQTEFLVTDKGAERSGHDIKIDYYEIPVLAKLYLSPARKICMIGGPAFAFKHRAQMPVKVPFSTPYGTYDRYEIRNIEDIKSFDLGLTLGGAMHFGLGQGSWFLELRYTISLIDICEDIPLNQQQNDKAYLGGGRNAVLMLGIGVEFPIRR